MSRFLFAVWSFETHVNPFLAVACALREAGHEVAFYAGPRGAKEIVGQRFHVFPFEALSEGASDAHVALILRDRKNSRKLRHHWFNFLVSQIPEQMEDLTRIIGLWRPDVLISDMAMLAPFTIIHDLGKTNVAVLSHVGYCMVPGPQGPIPGKAMLPRRSVLSRSKAGVIQAAANFVTRNIPRGVDAARLRYGFKATGLRVTEYHARIPLLLIPSVPDLDYNRSDLPGSVHYVGECLWPTPQLFEAEVLSGRPLIVVDEGSLFTEEPLLLRAAIIALNTLPYDVRMITGRHRDLEKLQLGDPAPHIQVMPWRPLEEVAANASLIITNGNTESVLSALSRAIPVVVVPAILDQSEIALRVQVSGAGLVVAEQQCTPERLRKLVAEVLTDKRFKERAEEAAKSLARYSGPPEAARMLEKLADRRG